MTIRAYLCHSEREQAMPYRVIYVTSDGGHRESLS